MAEQTALGQLHLMLTMDIATKLLTIFTLIQLSSVDSAPSKAKVLILGAGAAGIGFASKLYEKGEKDFLILEAQNYIGGRMRDVKFGQITIENGANWLHGIEKNHPIYVLKQKYGLNATKDDYNDFVARYVQPSYCRK